MTSSDAAAVVAIILAVVVAARVVLTANRRYIDDARERVVHDLRGPWCACCKFARVEVEGAECGWCAARHGRVTP